MRILGRVLLEGRKLTGENDATLLELLKPGYFDTLVSSCRNIAGYEENDGSTANKSYRAPTTAVHSGYEIKRAAEVLVGQAIRKKDKELLEDVQAFLQLYRTTEWHGKITAPALNNLKLKRLNVPEVLPLTSDLLLVRKYLVERLSTLTTDVTNDTTKQNWRELAEVCLTRLIMFNKRRGGEAGNMMLETFTNRPNIIHNKEIFQSLSPSEQQLCKRLDLVEIIGKRRRKVPVILTEDVKAAINALNTRRKEGGVCESSQYVFAVNDGRSMNPLRGHDVIKKTCKQVKLKEPELIKSTNLRKYIATVSQIVDMNESEMGWLANHLGHDIHVHKEFY
ncbi:uncharacterized protein LOC110455631 [Paramuricea clavata]|uniref:Uncharacterized protein LOC110455631 n=1 Tax=Paramuricea clavata TaxID=317549 RepID=A0A6S7H7G5_PARCT|nr:uncharacterized protein LOC110455631 [Paramuricea clavata]